MLLVKFGRLRPLIFNAYVIYCPYLLYSNVQFSQFSHLFASLFTILSLPFLFCLSFPHCDYEMKYFFFSHIFNKFILAFQVRGEWTGCGAWRWWRRWRRAWSSSPGPGTGAAGPSSPSPRTPGGSGPGPRTIRSCWTTYSGCPGKLSNTSVYSFTPVPSSSVVIFYVVFLRSNEKLWRTIL